MKQCDRLLVAEVTIARKTYNLLVDTGATSFLNLRSFSSLDSKEIEISSWSGVTAANARAIKVLELRLGARSVANLTLPAVDLSAIGKACGGRIDGILGVDLMEKLAVSIDVKRRVAKLDAEPLPSRAQETEISDATKACVAAFNGANAERFGLCLDPDIAWFTPWGELRGRERVIGYLRKTFMELKPPAAVKFDLRRVQPMGQAVLIEYDYTMTLPTRSYLARGTAIIRKPASDWLLVSAHNSVTRTVPEP